MVLGVASALLTGCPSRPAQASAPEVTPEQRAQDTRTRLATEPLRWTARHSTQADYELYVENQHTPHGWRRQLRTIDNGREALVIDLVEKDGLWHVLEPKSLAGVYRPFEVPLEPASHLEFLHRARLRFVGEEDLEWTMEGAALVAREEIPTGHLKGDSPRVRERRKLLEQGAEWRADPEAGWITHERFAELALTFSAFRWEEDPALAVPRDLTGRPSTSVEAPMLIARCHGTDFRLPCEADALIIDPSNPKIERRVPARGMAVPVAFLEGRQRVLVLRRDARGQQPVLIDLEKGTETPLGGGTLSWQFATQAFVASNGAQLLLKVSSTTDRTDAGLLMIDLSRPDDVSLEVRDRKDWPQAAGTAEAVVGLPDGRSLLRDAQTWFLVDEGGKRRRFGDGYRGYPAPAASPDGSALYFVRKDGFRFVAERVALSSPKNKTRIPLPPGRFEMPVWR